MMSFLVNNWFDILTILIALVALYFSVKAWQKSRAIYRLERKVLRQKTGDKDDAFINDEEINKKLSSGEYTILSVLERTKADGDWELLLGKLTRPKGDNENN